MQDQYQWEPDPEMEATVPAPIKRTLKKDSLLVFFRNLATLTASGKELVESLELAVNELGDANVESMAKEIAQQLRQGKTIEKAIANAMTLYPNIFSETSRALFLAAAESGNMDKVLNLIADNEESRGIKRRRIIEALMQPALILVSSLLLIIVAPVFFVDHIREFTSALDIPMPLLSQVVFGFSDIFRPKFAIPIILVGALAAAIAKVHPPDFIQKDWIFLRAIALGYRFRPVAKVLRTIGQAQWAQVMALQIDAGISLTKSLKTTRTALRDPEFQDMCRDLVASIEEGQTLTEAMKESGYFEKLVIAIVEVGEESGALPEMLQLIHSSCEEEFHMSMEMLEKLIAPLTMCLCGLLVGTWCIAIMLPMTAMLQALG